MKIETDKVISRKTMRETVIHEWLRPKGYELSISCLEAPAMKISLNLAFGSYKEFKRFIFSKFDRDLEHEDCSAMAVSFKHEGKEWHFMNIQKCEWYAEDYGTIAHELHHFIHFALDEKGNKYHPNGEETYAYLQGYFMELIIRAVQELKKSGGKSKKKKR